MKESTKAEGQNLRRETPEVRLVVDVEAAKRDLGEEARRMLDALPKFEPVLQ